MKQFIMKIRVPKKEYVDLLESKIPALAKNSVTKRYNGTVTVDGTSYSSACILCFYNYNGDNVNMEIGILTYPNIGKRLVYRSSHGGNLPTGWTSII